MSLISSFKGWVGEMQGTLAAKIRLDSEIYRSINNVTIPTANGTTQIDHVIVSKYGIFVVETKNIKGWIYGDEKQAQWTQVLQSARRAQCSSRLRREASRLTAPTFRQHQLRLSLGDPRPRPGSEQLKSLVLLCCHSASR